MKTLIKIIHMSTILLLAVFISGLFTGCTININIDKPSKEILNETSLNPINDTTSEISVYQSRSLIMYILDNTDDSSISSSDIVASEALEDTISAVLQAEVFQDVIGEQYPDADYELSVETKENTAIFTIIATSEKPEYLEEICNMAVSLLCEKIPQIVEGSSCKVVHYAKPAQLVGIN